MRVALAPDEPLLQRVGRILRAHDSVENVGYWAESTRSADFFVGLETDHRAELASARGAMVVTGDHHGLRGMEGVSVESLGSVLAAVEGSTVSSVSIASPGGRSGRIPTTFPAPVGRRLGSKGDDGIVRARSGAMVTALVVECSTGSRFAVVDDPQFLAAVCLAAAVLACPREASRTLQTADVAGGFLEAVQWAGVVIAGEIVRG
ncbi:MAG: hypothetical protein OEO77_08555 [Acidimicrobiia bacterium]|nr:hypothetical protein [Acidimicrobiia bacterium]